MVSIELTIAHIEHCKNWNMSCYECEYGGGDTGCYDSVEINGETKYPRELTKEDIEQIVKEPK